MSLQTMFVGVGLAKTKFKVRRCLLFMLAIYASIKNMQALYDGKTKLLKST